MPERIITGLMLVIAVIHVLPVSGFFGAERLAALYDVEIVDYHQEDLMPVKKLPPVYPGEVLLEEFLEPMEISQYRLAKDISVPPRRINEIVHGKRSIIIQH